MIRRVDDQRIQMRENVCEGKGFVQMQHLLESSDMGGKASFCAKMVVEPGSSLGNHQHVENAEIYYVLKGEVVSGTPEHEKVMKEGDISFTGNGECHFLENRSNTSAEVLAIVIC